MCGTILDRFERKLFRSSTSAKIGCNVCQAVHPKKIDSTSFQLTEKITTTIDETNSCSCDRRALWLVLMHAYFFKYIYVVAYTFYIIFLMNFEDIKCQLASRQSTSNSF